MKETREKRETGKRFIAGFVCGAMIFGCTGAYAAGVLAETSRQKVVIDGEIAIMQGYNIAGSNYFQLREIGKALNMAVNYDAAKNEIQIATDHPYSWSNPAVQQQQAQKNDTPQQKATLDVSVKYGSDGRPLSYSPKAGDVLYGTGNVSQTVNPYATAEYDGCMTIEEFLPGFPFPTEPLRPIDPAWDDSYYDIQMPNPVPCYTHALGQPSTFLGMEVEVSEESREMYVFNARETQRIIDTLYASFLKHPECYTDGKLNCTVRVGLTGSGFEGNFFYPYRDFCVEQTVSANTDYMVYAVDTYTDGVFLGTKYCCLQNCTPDNPDVLSSDTTIMKDRQNR